MHPIDLIVIAVYAVSMLAVGWYFSKAKTSREYLLGSGQMTPWMVGLSFFASLFSAISYLAYPGEIIKYGPMVLCILFAYPTNYWIVSRFIIPAFMKANVSSAYELLEIRLGVHVRLLASAIFVIIRLGWMSVIIYMCSVKIIVPLMGWSPDTSLWVAVVMGIITVIYTSMGGLKAVVFTDVVQTFLLLGGALLTITVVCFRLGGFGLMFPSSWPETWLEWSWFDTSVRASFGTVFLMSMGYFVCTSGSDQMAVQRYLATRDIKSARKMVFISMLTYFFVYILLGLIGASLLAYFTRFPEFLPEGNDLISSADQLFPYFIVIGLPKGISGLIIAGLMAAAMSSLSSGVNSSCMAIVRDFIVRFSKKEYTDQRQVFLSKMISLAVGAMVVVLSLLVGYIRGNLFELTFKTSNLFVGALFVPFFMALYIKWAKEKAVLLGTVAGMLTAVLVGFQAELFGRQWITFLWIVPLSFTAGTAVSLLFSLGKSHRDNS